MNFELNTYFVFLQPPETKDFITLFVQKLTGQTAALQTALWGGPRPRYEPGTDSIEAGTLTTGSHTSTTIQLILLVQF